MKAQSISRRFVVLGLFRPILFRSSLFRSNLLGTCLLFATLFVASGLETRCFSQEKTAVGKTVPSSTSDKNSLLDEKSDASPLPPALPQEEYQLADLPPLKRLVLYNSGVGQLQHSGIVDGKTRLQIRFGSHDVDDVLRSLVFEDRGSGTVRAVEYQPAPEPEDVAASQIGQPMTLAQLLQKFRGEPILIVSGGTQLQGIIYGVENRAKGTQLVETLILMLADGLRSVELNRVDRFQFTNQQIQKDLKLAMAGLAKSRKANEKQLDLLLDGEGKRTIQFAYVVDVPVWRMTYRIALDDDNAAIQGWAHVDNVTGVDWENVAMELRSGKPQSFHASVFAPLMVARPEVGTSVFDFTRDLALISDLVTGGTGWQGGRGGGGLGGGGFGGSGAGFGGGLFGSNDRNPTRSGVGAMDVTSSFQETATEGRASQMVRYVLDAPVNLGAGKSAALPVFSETLPAKRISVYTHTKDAVVFRALQLTNSTKLPFVSGPVSIVENGDFVGDGSLPRLNVDEQSEIVYGVDRAVEVSRENGLTERSLAEVTIEKRRVHLKFRSVRKTKFIAENKDIEARNLIIHFLTWSRPRKAGDPLEVKSFAPEPIKIDGDRVTYSLEVAAQSTSVLEISISHNESNFQSLATVSVSTVNAWKRLDIKIEESDLEFLESLAGMHQSIAVAQAEISKISEEKQASESEQSRVREILKVVSPNREAGEVYLDQMQSLEGEIQTAKKQLVAAKIKLYDLQKAKDKKIDEYQPLLAVQ